MATVSWEKTACWFRSKEECYEGHRWTLLSRKCVFFIFLNTKTQFLTRFHFTSLHIWTWRWNVFYACLIFSFVVSRKMKPISRMEYNYIMCSSVDMTGRQAGIFWIARRSRAEKLVLRVVKNVGYWCLQVVAAAGCELSLCAVLLHFWGEQQIHRKKLCKTVLFVTKMCQMFCRKPLYFGIPAQIKTHSTHNNACVEIITSQPHTSCSAIRMLPWYKVELHILKSELQKQNVTHLGLMLQDILVILQNGNKIRDLLALQIQCIWCYKIIIK